MRNRGVEIDRRVLRDSAGTRGQLAITDTTDQGKNRPTKVAKLSQGELVRAELRDVQIVWLAEGRMTLTGYEQINDMPVRLLSTGSHGLSCSIMAPPSRKWASAR